MVAHQELGAELFEQLQAAERVAPDLDGVAGEDEPVVLGLVPECSTTA